MRDRAHEQVLAALLRMHCSVLREDEYFVSLIRGATVIQQLPKTYLVPVGIQRRILRAFHLDEAEYVRILTGVS